MDSDYNSTTGGFTTTPMGTLPIPLVPGKFGNAIQTNGSNQFLQVDGPENNFDFVGQSMSLSAWFTADTIDKVDPRELSENVAVLASVAYVIADLPSRIGDVNQSDSSTK